MNLNRIVRGPTLPIVWAVLMAFALPIVLGAGGSDPAPRIPPVSGDKCANNCPSGVTLYPDVNVYVTCCWPDYGCFWNGFQPNNQMSPCTRKTYHYDDAQGVLRKCCAEPHSCGEDNGAPCCYNTKTLPCP